MLDSGTLWRTRTIKGAIAHYKGKEGLNEGPLTPDMLKRCC